MDLRKYLAIARSQVMVFQLLLKSQSGTVPFPLLAMLGGSHLLRGYYTGRFRDKNLLVLQAEWRCPLFWRIGLSVFAGMGQVADRFSHLNAGNFHYSTGLGLRLLYNRKESIHARMDFALGKDSSGIYMEGDESF
jgi:outer membrane protein assembly factor BamA